MLFFRSRFFWKSIGALFAFLAINAAAFSQCPQSYSWTTWSSFNGMSANGNVTSNNKSIDVTMTANYTFDSTGSIFLLADYFAPYSGYAQIKDGTVPRTTWSVGKGGKTTICFSEPVTNPILLLASLGRPSNAVTLSFSEPYVPLFNGGGMEFLDGYSLSGKEGNCIVLFPGTFRCVTINSNTPEYYTNITWGLQTPAFPVTITETAAVCGSTTLTAQGGISYQWNGGNQPQQAVNVVDTNGVYTVTATDARGCTAVALKSITTISKQTITSDIAQTICSGQTYLGYAASGVYQDTLSTTAGCDSIRTLRLMVLEEPVATPVDTVGIDQPLVAGNPDPNLSYLWEHSNETTRQITAPGEGTYRVTITNQFGCLFLKTYRVVATMTARVFAPDAFSPNGDSINDVFRIILIQSTPLTFTVYNRWGAPVFSTDQQEASWDGTCKNEPCAAGNYVYRLRYQNLPDQSITEKQGTFLLIR